MKKPLLDPELIALFALIGVGIFIGGIYTNFENEKALPAFKKYYSEVNISSAIAYLEETAPKYIKVKVGNPSDTDITIEHIRSGRNTYRPNQKIKIKASDFVNMPAYNEVIFYSEKETTTPIESLVLVYEENGKRKSTLINPWKEREPAKEDFLRKEPNYKDFSFIKESNSLIQFAIGNHAIGKNIIFPPGKRVEIPKGTTLNLLGGAKIFSRSPVSILGTKDLPIVIKSSDKKGQGIVVLEAGEKSYLKNANFINLSANGEDYWNVSGAVVFYESDVDIDNCKFIGNLIGDDYLNIVRSMFLIANSVFEDVNADAFDSDFCTGDVNNVVFNMVGNDCIDISGSDITVANTIINDVGDKGLSSGEGSNLIAKNVSITNAEIALTSKDKSTIKGENIEVNDSRLGIAIFQKKPEYGPASIELSNYKTDNIQTSYLLEKKSSLIINGKKQKHTDKNVKKKLYGAEYGKSSR